MAGQPDGRVALVTGASRGIGRGIAHALAADGARVAVVSRTREGVDRVVEEITAAGGSAVAVVCDVGDPEAIKRAVATVVERCGRIDILVNAAQGCGSADAPAASTILTPLEDLPESHWEYSFLTGATATLRFMQACFPQLKASGAGRIINFGSMWGQMGQPGAAAYNANKEAIRGLSRTAAREWGVHGITVNVINPVIATDMFVNYIREVPEAEAQFLAQTPMNRLGDPQKDAGRVAAFIAGPDASFLTGMTFQVDGGMYMHP